MAKKKVAHNHHQPQNEILQTNPTNQDISDEKIERLKSLNTLLLKEATDRRHQVDSLMEAKGSLESVLTRTNSDKEEMLSELGKLSEEGLRLELERVVVFVYVSLQVGEFSEVVMRGRGEIEVLEKEMREVLREKREIEEAKRGNEREVFVLEERVKGLLDEIGVEKSVCERVERERDEIEVELGVRVKEGEELRVKLVEMEGKLKGVEEEMEKLGEMYAGVVVENEERGKKIEVLIREKGMIESEAGKVVEEMEGEIAKIEKEKEGIEEEISLEKAKRVELEGIVTRLNETVLNLDRVEERLRMDVAELEKKCGEGEEKQMEMAMEIDQLVGEKNDLSKGLERVVEEKSLVEKNLDEALKQLDNQKKELEIVENEKTKILEVLSGKEIEIGELQKEVSEFEQAVKKLESSCTEGIVKIKNLESEVGRYKDTLDQVTSERDEGREVIDEEKQKGLELLQKIEDMAKIIEEKAMLVDELKAENAGLCGEKGKLESLCGKLKTDLALAESALVELRKEFDTFRGKVELEKESSKRVFDLLKGTAAKLVSSINDEKNGTDGEKQLNGGGSEPYITELEIIKNVFKKKEIKSEEMQMQIEILKNSVAEEQKKKSFWTLLSSATSILATISLAYIARGR